MEKICSQCGTELAVWMKKVYLDLQEGQILNIPNRIPVDVYSCPACGKLEFFRANFSPKEKKRAPAEPDPDPVDTTGYYEPGSGPDVKCPVCGKEHPADDPFCPLCGTRRDQPCAWCGRRFSAGETVCPFCGGRREEI